MATSNLSFNADIESALSSYTISGQLIFTEIGIRLVKTDGTKVKYDSIVPVSVLPTTGDKNKLYILTTDYSLNYYDIVWHKVNENIDTGLGLNVKKYNAIGDGTTDDTSAIQTTIDTANKNVVVPNGNYNITSIDNKYGKQFIGEGKILKNGVLYNSYADKFQYIFGREYLSAFHKKIMNNIATKIVFSGDSTTYGDGLTDLSFSIDKLTYELFQKTGITNVTTINHGHCGKSAKDWISTYLSDDLSSLPDLLILRWGLNDVFDPSPIDNFISSVRSGLATIRATRDISSLSIILMSPNSAQSSVFSELYLETIIPAIKQVARDFNCVFIDTYAFFKDSRNASDWMDTQETNSHIHPHEVMNLWISNIIFETIFPTSMRLKYGNINNTSTVVNDATVSQKGIIMLKGDIGGTSSNIEVQKIKGIPVDVSNAAKGKILLRDENGNIGFGDISVAGIIGQATITEAGSQITINAGEEKIFAHPTSDKIIPSIIEVINGSDKQDTHINFNKITDYYIQDISKILINNNVTLKMIPSLLMHFNDSTIIDECGNNVVNNNVTANTSTTKIGSASGAFNGINSYLSVENNINFGLSDFTVEWYEYRTSASSDAKPVLAKSAKSYIFGYLASGGTTPSIYLSSDGISWDIADHKQIGNLLLNQWVHRAICRKGNTFYAFENGILYTTFMSSLAIYNDSSNILIGKWSGDNTNLFSGYLDELCITLGNAKYQDTFTSPISDIGKYTNLPMYVSTLPTNNFSLTAINQINSITMPVSVPTGTNVNCLLSFDNGVHKLYKDASGFHIFTGDLSQLWTYCNSYSEIIGYFTNKTIDSITSDLTPLNIIPASIDLYWQLVSDGVNTPIVSPIAINYTTSSYEEFASFGGYTDSYVKYGVKRLSTNTISVKNKSTETTTIKVNLVIS